MASEREQEWVEEYCRTGDAKAAAAKIFPDNADHSTRASQLKAKLKNDIEQYTREQFAAEAPVAVNVVRELAQTAKSETVKLKAALEWLGYAGFNAPTVIEHRQVETREQLEAKAKALLLDPDVQAVLRANPELTDSIRH